MAMFSPFLRNSTEWLLIGKQRHARRWVVHDAVWSSAFGYPQLLTGRRRTHKVILWFSPDKSLVVPAQLDAGACDLSF